MRLEACARLAATAALVLLVGACEQLREQMGLNKSAPDEFRVVAQAPLEMPGDLQTLPTPQPGAPRPQEGTPTDQARRSVFGAGSSQGAAVGQSGAEVALVTKVGAAEPNIRQTVDAETAAYNEDESSLLDSITFWRDPEPHGTIVDSEKEAQRIKENAALGKPVTEGETPVIVRKQKAIFEGIF